jgi:hypothetical protein
VAGIPTKTMHKRTTSYELDYHPSFYHKRHAFETSSSLVEPFTLVDPVLDKAVWRKMDLWLLPTVAMFYLLSFLVRLMAIADYGHANSLFLCRIGLISPTLEWLDCKSIWE